MSLDAAFLDALAALAAVRPDEPLSRHTTIGIGGPADALISATTADQLAAVLDLCQAAGVSVFVLGSGSNIVVGDGGIRGLTIANGTAAQTEPRRLDQESERYLVRVEAGASFALTARRLAAAGLEGLEWACGIPGTVGGAVVYNAGAYGGCLADVLERIGVWDEATGVVEYAKQALGLVYRGSAFTRGLMQGRVVLWAEFALWPGDTAALRARIADYDSRRLKAQPRGRNAGSFFKNPPGRPAWKLIEAVGLRGYRLGGAALSAKHCNFLINNGDATAADVVGLTRLAQGRVRDQFGLELETEVSLVGEGFGDG